MGKRFPRAEVSALVALLLGSSQASSALPTWDQAFGDAHPALHLQATYPDARGKSQPLEFWRDAAGRVVRRTGNRAELHLTPANDGEDLYQFRNLLNKTAFDVHRINLFRVGVMTDRWSVQHLLDKPAAASTLNRLNRSAHTPAGDCAWWRMSTGSKVSEVCWSSRYGVPLLLTAAGHTLLKVMRVEVLGTLPPPAAPQGWQEYNADEDLAPD